MKRVIALLMAVTFCISIFATPISAVCPNPNDARFVRGGTPNGDDSPWIDVDSNAPSDDTMLSGVFNWIESFLRWQYGSSRVEYFLVINKSFNSDSKKNDKSPLTDNSRGR